MLIKTTNENTRPVIISALLHLSVLAALILSNQFANFFQFPSEKQKENEKIIQVVDVPPDLKHKFEEPVESDNYSDKSRRVDKETYTDHKRTTPLERPTSKSSKDETTNKVKKDSKADNKIGLKQKEKDKKQTAKLFPSDERMGELIKNYETQSTKNETGKVLSLNTSDLKYYKYLSDMKRRIEFYWDYPRPSIKKGEQGYINIDFTITKEGRIENVKVVQSSNYPALDDAAVSAIRLANPFNPFPEHFEIEDLVIKSRFNYTLVGRGGGRSRR